jgi:hypothetical protein
VLVKGLGEDQNIVQVYQTAFPFKTGQHDVHHVLKSAWSIAEAKRHYFKFQKPISSDERSFGSVFLPYFYLPIAKLQIDDGEILRPL